MKIKEYLKSLNLFATTGEEELDFLTSITTLTSYPIGATLFYETDIQKNLLFLVEGLIKVYKAGVAIIYNIKMLTRMKN